MTAAFSAKMNKEKTIKLFRRFYIMQIIMRQNMKFNTREMNAVTFRKLWLLTQRIDIFCQIFQAAVLCSQNESELNN